MRNSAGDIYEGEFKHDTMEGKGIYYFKDGRSYEGEFKNGNRSGNGINSIIFIGTMRYLNNAIYIGEWKDNRQHGKGKFA